MDLIENPEIVHYCLGKLFDLEYENTRRIFERIPGRITYLLRRRGPGRPDRPDDLRPPHPRVPSARHEADDRPGPPGRGLRLPPRRRQLPPHPARSDRPGHRPAQSHPVALSGDGAGGAESRFRRRGSSSTAAWTTSSPCRSGRVDDVRREVLDNLRILGAGGGYILAPCHNIQALTPPENVVALYETGRRKRPDLNTGGARPWSSKRRPRPLKSAFFTPEMYAREQTLRMESARGRLLVAACRSGAGPGPAGRNRLQRTPGRNGQPRAGPFRRGRRYEFLGHRDVRPPAPPRQRLRCFPRSRRLSIRRRTGASTRI